MSPRIGAGSVLSIGVLLGLLSHVTGDDEDDGMRPRGVNEEDILDELPERDNDGEGNAGGSGRPPGASSGIGMSPVAGFNSATPGPADSPAMAPLPRIQLATVPARLSSPTAPTLLLRISTGAGQPTPRVPRIHSAQPLPEATLRPTSRSVGVSMPPTTRQAPAATSVTTRPTGPTTTSHPNFALVVSFAPL